MPTQELVDAANKILDQYADMVLDMEIDDIVSEWYKSYPMVVGRCPKHDKAILANEAIGQFRDILARKLKVATSNGDLPTRPATPPHSGWHRG